MISVVVPIYNSQRYIKECLSSILKQTYRDLEVLLVDDGSRDASYSIGCEYMKQDSRIRLWTREHQGVSAARNFGLSMAEGDYIFFMDSDDTAASYMLEELLDQMVSQRADMAFGQYRQADNGGNDKTEWMKEKQRWLRLDNGAMVEQFSQNHQMFGGIGGKLIRKKAIGDLQFEESFLLGEDTWFLYNLICKGISAVYTTDAMYYYRKHENGSWKLRFTLEGTLASGAVFKQIERREQEYGRIEHARFWEGEYIRVLRRAMDCLPKEELYQMREEVIQEMKNPYFQERSWRTKGTVFLAFFCYPLYCRGKGFNRWIKDLCGGRDDNSI